MSGVATRLGAWAGSLVKSFQTPYNIPCLSRQFSTSKVTNMKLVQFTYNTKPCEIRVGYLQDGNVVDVNKADPRLPKSLIEILKNGSLCQLGNIKAYAEPISSVTLVAPITGMDKILCVGLNYADHCAEQKKEPPPVPMIFSKFASCIIGPNEPLRLRTDVTNKVDWEVELVVVIGKTCSNVKAADVYNYILGYTVAQDISSRDWQKHNAGQFLLGKAQDTYCPIGPCIVTCDEICDPHDLKIKCSVNGVEKQTSNTSNLIFRIPELIERISSVMTLLPGDILLTGTPGGVGVHRNPPEYLKPGDCIRSEIQNIGAFDVRVTKF